MDIKRTLADAITKAEKFMTESPAATAVIASAVVVVVALLLLRA